MKCWEYCNGKCDRCDQTDTCEVFIEYMKDCGNYPPQEQITEEDIWYAMTDGMYGDYPGGDIDYDKLGFD